MMIIEGQEKLKQAESMLKTAKSNLQKIEELVKITHKLLYVVSKRLKEENDRMIEKSCLKCGNALHSTTGIRCKIHGYFFLDYVASVTTCTDFKEK
jgi:predicted ArsR family transcriptional regulator